MSSVKVVTLVGTRPELIKLSRTIAELDLHTKHVLVHSGQNYDPELSSLLFAELGLRSPDYQLDTVGRNAVETMSKVLMAFDQVLEQESPDAVVYYGDTNTGLGLIAAKKRRIPIFHLEAGNRCYDPEVPEELNRRLIDHLSDVNLPLTEHARRCLLAEGIAPDCIFKIGSPLTEVLRHYRPQIDASPILQDLSLTPGQYFLVSVHREENVDWPSRLDALLQTLQAIAGTFGLPIIFSAHPRTRRRLDERAADGGKAAEGDIRYMKPFGFFSYVALQRNAACVLSDSGSLTEESSILDFPAIALRRAHERPEGMDEGAVLMAGLNPERVIQAIRLAMAHRREDGRSFRLVGDYTDHDVSRQTVRIVLSYIDYVRRKNRRAEL
jgi:UDP-N-acetylglucosamine 2-epimerase